MLLMHLRFQLLLPSFFFCQIKGSIKVLKDHGSKVKVKSLINALRFTTKHLNDETTPKIYQKMLEG